jgi:DNA-binding NarL/FixJ family response regulator
VKGGRALVEAAASIKPDLIIADITMPILNGLEAARQILRDYPHTKVVFLSMHSEAIYAAQAIRAGASAYLMKHAAGDELLAAIPEIRAGGIYLSSAVRDTVADNLRHKRSQSSMGELTARQREVLQLLAEGRPIKEIAERLHVSKRTVEFHKYRLMQVLGIKTVAELAGFAVRQGIVR